MTIGSLSTQTTGSTGNGVTTSFSFSFPILANGDVDAEDQIEVRLVTISSGVETVLTKTTHYTVSVNADQDSSPGGSITTVTAYSSAYKIYIRRSPNFLQSTDFTNQGGFLTQVVEDTFDQVKIELQDLRQKMLRAPHMGLQSTSVFDGEIEGTPTAGYVPIVNGSLDGWTLGTPAAGATISSQMANVVTASTRLAAGAMLAGGAISVKDPTYGAVGDGATDDTTAIASALAAAISTGNALYFPPGTYIVSTLTITGQVLIFGAGIGVSTLKIKNTSNNYILYGTGVSNVTILDMTFDGNQANNASVSSAFRFEGASNFIRIEEVEVKNCRTAGISLSGTGTKAIIRGCYVHDCVSTGIAITGFTDGLCDENRCDSNGDSGIALAGSAHRWRIHHNTCNSNTAVSTGGSGIVAVSSDDCEASGNVCTSNAGHGIQWNTCNRARSIGNRCTSNTISGLDYYASPNGVSAANVCRLNTVRGIEIDSASDDHTSEGDIALSNGSEGISVFRSARASIISPNVQNNNTTSAVGGIRFWTNAGAGATSGSDNGRVMGGRSIDLQGGSATQTYGIVVQTGTTGISVDDCYVATNLTGTISADAGTVAIGAAAAAKIGTLLTTAGSFELCLTGVNFNSANTDNAIPIYLPPGFTRYVVTALRISGASASLTTATCGLFTATGAGGTAIVTSASAITVSTASEGTNNNAQGFTINNTATQSYTTGTLYFRVQTAQGSAATANVHLTYQPQI